MKIKQYDNWWEFSEKQKVLAKYYYQNKNLYKINGHFEWLKEAQVPMNVVFITSVAEIYGEEQLDFADEYLLLHGEEYKNFFWEP
ncbi:hypothetical protein [Candidatus Uabimicrobium sp. HlEnr_7]|uniref:hypothetical protein n=1 Tax=Candidatus Uabimicrobium helgolandensis TaxID=3095367 RepID=UPI003557B68B